jgi:probable DNA repair protein
MAVPAGIVAALEAGATLVTPSPQRAAALREAWARRQLAAGRRVWATPDILPFDAFAERCLREQEEQGAPRRRLLSAVEQQLLWREVATSLSEDSVALLSGPGRLAEALRRADALMRRYAIAAKRLQAEPSPEARWLREARLRIDARLGRWQARLDWSDETVAPAGAPGLVRLAGFTEITPAQRSLLDACGVDSSLRLEGPVATEPVATPVLYAAPHPADELEQLARWCRERLTADPGARLLVVVPDLDARRALVQRALLAELEPQALAAGRTRSAMFAFEGGAPLLAEPRIAADMARLERLIARLDRERWLGWLRSPDSGAESGAWRIALEQRLLSWQGQALDFDALLAVAGLDGGGLPAPLERMRRAAAPLAMRTAPPAQWARAFDQALGGLQAEPGPLDSAAWQVRERWCRMLEDYAAASAVVGPVTALEALGQLRSIAARTRFAPASPDVPVLVTAATADPIIDYDGIWVAGLHDAAFPRPARIDGLLPGVLQRASGVVEADPRALLERAEREFAAWRARTRELVVSWAREDGGAEQPASPLLRPWLGQPQHELAIRRSRAAADWLRQQASATGLEQWRDPAGLAVPAGAVLPGGAALLQSAGQCAFRGYAEWRLGARAPEEPESGVGVLLRGRLLHDALESLWRGWRSQAGLRTIDPQRRREAVAAALTGAIGRLGRGRDAPVARRAIERELSRAAALILELVEHELERAPFQVLGLERNLPLPLDGFSLHCRVDRVDRLADGSVAVIDYKTGRGVPTDWSGERPDTVQMIAYRAAVQSLVRDSVEPNPRLEVAALGYLQLSEGRVGYRGVARDPATFGPVSPRRRQGPDWAQRTAAWDAYLQWLAGRVRSGEATVEPRATVCRSCDLSLLCRRAELEAGSDLDENAGPIDGDYPDDETAGTT